MNDVVKNEGCLKKENGGNYVRINCLVYYNYSHSMLHPALVVVAYYDYCRNHLVIH